MDIEEVLAGMIAALRSGSTFAMIVHSDSKSQQCICSSAVNTKLFINGFMNVVFQRTAI